MRSIDGDPTDGPLLERLGDWTDHDAWSEFTRCYDRLIGRVVGSYRFSAEATDEVRQRIWIELAGRMRGYRYDPSKRFRAWLTRLCRSRSLDYWRFQEARRTREPLATPGELPASELPEDDEPARPDLLRRAAWIQEAVKARVDARTWEVFWRITVEDEAIAEVAESVSISYAAAFAAQKRVRRMLREEAARTNIETGATP